LVNVKFGYSAEKIREIQEIVGTGIDGLYGKKTLSAVKKYQEHLSDLGLYEGRANGLWDDETERASMAKRDMPSELEQLRQILADLDQEERIYMIHLQYHTEQTNIFHSALGYRQRVHMASEVLFEIGTWMLVITSIGSVAEGVAAVRVGVRQAGKGLLAWEVIKGAAKARARRIIGHEIMKRGRQGGLKLAFEGVSRALKKQREAAEKDEDAYLYYHYLRHNIMRKLVADIFASLREERTNVLDEIRKAQSSEENRRRNF
jgi:hypothetical protein